MRVNTTLHYAVVSVYTELPLSALVFSSSTICLYAARLDHQSIAIGGILMKMTVVAAAAAAAAMTIIVIITIVVVVLQRTLNKRNAAGRTRDCRFTCCCCCCCCHGDGTVFIRRVEDVDVRTHAMAAGKNDDPQEEEEEEEEEDETYSGSSCFNHRHKMIKREKKRKIVKCRALRNASGATM